MPVAVRTDAKGNIPTTVIKEPIHHDNEVKSKPITKMYQENYDRIKWENSSPAM